MKSSWGGNHHFHKKFKHISNQENNNQANKDDVFFQHPQNEMYLAKTEGIDPDYVGMLSNYVGCIYKNYGNDPHSKLLLLMCATLMCSQS